MWSSRQGGADLSLGKEVWALSLFLIWEFESSGELMLDLSQHC